MRKKSITEMAWAWRSPTARVAGTTVIACTVITLAGCFGGSAVQPPFCPSPINLELLGAPITVGEQFQVNASHPFEDCNTGFEWTVDGERADGLSGPVIELGPIEGETGHFTAIAEGDAVITVRNPHGAEGVLEFMVQVE